MSTRSILHVRSQDGIGVSIYKHSDGYPEDCGNGWLIYNTCNELGHNDIGTQLIHDIIEAGWRIEIIVPRDIDPECRYEDAEYIYFLERKNKSVHVQIDQGKWDSEANEMKWETIFSDDFKKIPEKFSIYGLTPKELNAFHKDPNLFADKLEDYLKREPRFLLEIPKDMVTEDLCLLAAEVYGEKNLEKKNAHKYIFSKMCAVAEKVFVSREQMEDSMQKNDEQNQVAFSPC